MFTFARLVVFSVEILDALGHSLGGLSTLVPLRCLELLSSKIQEVKSPKFRKVAWHGILNIVPVFFSFAVGLGKACE